ncbi:histone-lysine N-methyltransferase Set2 isoform X2 [Prorops nasuta]|uniref:histone-lysine N-methyltransferase Set2 isoform X2 n=1 Tax=Prorops nasuta TaxID=863751 RepID=UPI0034CF0A72
MARKRKTEGKASAKTSPKYVAVRKSSRQIAKKQQEDRKINGDISQSSSSNSPDETRTGGDDQGQMASKKKDSSQRKFKKHRSFVNNAEVANDNAISNPLTYKREIGESDSQDGLENSVNHPNKISTEDVRQVVVGNSNPNSESSRGSASNEVEVWSEDVIEETIICEEMEVEEDAVGNNYSQEQGSNIMVEQVLLMNDSNTDGKNFMEFTVIQNDDGTESMVMTDNSDSLATNHYHIIEEGVSTLHVTEPESAIAALYKESTSIVNTVPQSKEESLNSLKTHLNRKSSEKKPKKEKTNEKRKDKSRQAKLNSMREDSVSSIDSLEENNLGKSFKVKQQISEKEEQQLKLENTLSNVNNSKEIEKLVNDLSSTENVESPIHSAAIASMDRTPLSQDDESNCSILDKMEQLHQSNPKTASVTDVEEGSKHNNLSKSEESKAKGFQDEKSYPNRLLLKSKTIRDKKSSTEKNCEQLQVIEEIFGFNEIESKPDGDDNKVSSSSENSNDTLLSTNSNKAPEAEVKGSSNQTNESEKKGEFRSRSGSTDTTGSESGSNSSGVRRSSRIRSIGLMKQRPRGRGLVTKPAIEAPKMAQEREKVNTPVITDTRISQDNQSETQSDKENSGNKISTPLNSPAQLITTSTTGYDSDSSKPVKVKSRWRRSSELEMGGSSGFVPGPVSNFSFPPTESITRSLISTSSSVNGTEAGSFQSRTEENVESSKSVSSTVTTFPKIIGAKISLPMVPEMRDREMEERLSQFEHLKENLYLTDRFTNKETKRMVCDCFLTEEEIERGELGCGEDCLNRLLMIECGPRCVVGSRCTNRRFQNCDYAKCEVFRTEKKGFGLRAIVDLFAGEFIMEYVGEVVDPKDFRRRAKEYSKDKNRHYYFMALKSDQIIDATMKGNVSRFINHSCDPNAETQKWTVNGELRIGFFNKKFIAAGEEITFDYHFQRYGKEAQKCFCEALNCRGWIGDTPEEEKEKIEKKEKREKESRKKKEEKKISDYMEDEDLEEEIDKLCVNGLKNRVHTLTLSRLMVRSREMEHRTRLLKLIQTGEQPCRRLFLDYHGLRLIWSYVMDIATDESEEAQQFRLEVLRTLNTLPIPNKTMLMDSKIYGVVEKWANRLYLSPAGDSPEDEESKGKVCNEEEEDEEEKEKKSLNIPENLESEKEVKKESENSLIPEMALTLLAEWSNLKEVFRIPKKERIEQMKEHEREADRGYREELEKDEKRGSSSYDRQRPERFNRPEDKRIERRRGGRESPDSEHKVKDKRLEERSALVPIPRMSKYERRQLFALKVAKEEEERQRRQQQGSWQEHEARCLALGIDPHTTAMVDPQTGYPLFFNPNLGQWQHYPTQDGAEVSQQCTPVYVGGPQVGTPPILQSYVEKVGVQEESPQPEIPPIDLPPKWKSARDARGRTYYYHVKERISQWLPPPPDHIGVQPDSSSTSESSDESSSSNEDEDDVDDENLEEPKNEDMEVDLNTCENAIVAAVATATVKFNSGKSERKRRDGLVQERIISPRREEDRVDHKKYKEMRDKLRRQREKTKVKEHVEKPRKHRRSNKSKSHSRHTVSKLQNINDAALISERKIKDTFRINMANVMVHFLNPYRKNDCKQGRITNTEDFKHLARKLTHFVLAKELKHCKSVDELQCNENVKHKAKDFVRKYMSKFGAVYQKASDED